MTSHSLPQRTTEQRLADLEKAKQARQHRGEFRDRIRRGDLTLAEVFQRADKDHADYDEVLAGIKIAAVLKDMCKKNTQKAHALLATAKVNDRRRLRGVGDTQRAVLIRLVDGADGL